MTETRMKQIFIDVYSSSIKWFNKPAMLVIRFHDKKNDVWWTYKIDKKQVAFLGDSPEEPWGQKDLSFEIYVTDKQKRDLIRFLARSVHRKLSQTEVHGYLLRLILTQYPDWENKFTNDTPKLCDIIEIMKEEINYVDCKSARELPKLTNQTNFSS